MRECLDLKREIQKLRHQLYKLYKGNRIILNDELLLKSQELDILIFKYQKECKVKELSQI
ncbi:aspartyl-phosphate phosphatase Spo0E family protein [Metabacillus indicus]|uniref:aspartyl-phosphate phosphatase Spo0E family protein n=1 Tax=Metabacillus indicus TaxID=246786 RepID=UPI003CD0DF26